MCRIPLHVSIHVNGNSEPSRSAIQEIRSRSGIEGDFIRDMDDLGRVLIDCVGAMLR